MIKSRSTIVWAVVGVAVHVAVLLYIANRFDQTAIIEAHDAGFYITHLRDPLLLGDIPDWWDNIPYRALRVGYIVLALPFRWLGEVPALAIANLIAVGFGAWAIQNIAIRHGVSPRIAAAVWILNPGAIIATALLLPDTIAWATILLVLLAVDDKRWGWAAAFGIFAVATKEASLAALAIVAVAGWFRRDWRVSIPFLAGVTWQAAHLGVLVMRFGSSFHSEFVVWPPLGGWIEAWSTGWDGRTLSLLAGSLVFVAGMLTLFTWWRNKTSVYLAAAAGQALLMLGLDRVVIVPISNSVRIAGLFFPLLVACCLRTSQDDEAPGTPSIGERQRSGTSHDGRHYEDGR